MFPSGTAHHAKEYIFSVDKTTSFPKINLEHSKQENRSILKLVLFTKYHNYYSSQEFFPMKKRDNSNDWDRAESIYTKTGLVFAFYKTQTLVAVIPGQKAPRTLLGQNSFWILSVNYFEMSINTVLLS